MSKVVMLVLIGGRSAVPTIAGILQFLNEVDKIKFLLCKGEQYLKLQKNIEAVIKSEKENFFLDYETDVVSVDPSKFDEVYLAVSKLCDDVENLKYVNLTSAPQTMSIPVYSYIQEKYKDVLVFSVNTDQAQIIPLVFRKPSIPFNKRLTVDNYIVLHDINIFKKKKTYGTDIEELVKYIIERIELQLKFISEIRRSSGAGDEIKAIRGFKIDTEKFIQSGTSIDELEKLLQKLEDFSIIYDLQKIEKILKFKVKPYEYQFLNGDWLEVFVYSCANQCRFDSVEMGVELANYKGEIDVFCLNNANAMICECKTGINIETDDINSLSSKGEKLGGNYCVKLFITTSEEISDKFRNTADNNRVVVVSRQQLINLPEILMREMQSPKYPRR